MLLFRQHNPEWEKKWSGENITTIEIVVQETENVNDRVPALLWTVLLYMLYSVFLLYMLCSVRSCRRVSLAALFAGVVIEHQSQHTQLKVYCLGGLLR